MSSGFVSGGSDEPSALQNDDWLKAKEEIEENRRRRTERDQSQGNKSLYDTLQANKAAKQEAFEESIRLKNQFRSLNEDELEFLDSVLESTRAKESAIKKETSEQLDIFRKQQEEADKASINVDDPVNTSGHAKDANADEEWAVSSRKRKKGKQDSQRMLKLRKHSSTDTQGESKTMDTSPRAQSVGNSGEKLKEASTTATTSATKSSGAGTGSAQSKNDSSKAAKINVLGLGSYSSEDEE